MDGSPATSATATAVSTSAVPAWASTSGCSRSTFRSSPTSTSSVPRSEWAYPLRLTERSWSSIQCSLARGDAEQNEARLRVHEDAFGPAGLIGPDDVEVVMRRVPAGMQANLGNPWILMSKGLNREEIDDTTDVPQRPHQRRDAAARDLSGLARRHGRLAALLSNTETVRELRK